MLHRILPTLFILECEPNLFINTDQYFGYLQCLNLLSIHMVVSDALNQAAGGQNRASTTGPSSMASCRSRSAPTTNRSPILWAGIPAWISYGGMFLVTTDPAPTIAPRPIRTPARIVALKPTHTSSSMIVVGTPSGRPEKMIGDPGIENMWSLPTIDTYGASIAYRPSSTRESSTQPIFIKLYSRACRSLAIEQPRAM
jgi:hypothetical protein